MLVITVSRPLKGAKYNECGRNEARVFGCGPSNYSQVEQQSIAAGRCSAALTCCTACRALADRAPARAFTKRVRPRHCCPIMVRHKQAAHQLGAISCKPDTTMRALTTTYAAHCFGTLHAIKHLQVRSEAPSICRATYVACESRPTFKYLESGGSSHDARRGTRPYQRE